MSKQSSKVGLAVLAASVLLVALCGVYRAEAGELWGVQTLGVYDSDSLAWAGQWSFQAANYINGAGGGFGSFTMSYDLFPDAWFAVVVYDYGSAAYDLIMYTWLDML